MRGPRPVFMKGLSQGLGLKLILLSQFIYLFGVLRHFQHCTGHITTGSWKGRGNQYIQFVRVLYCKLPTNSKQLPAFPLEAVPGIYLRGRRRECYHSATVAPTFVSSFCPKTAKTFVLGLVVFTKNTRLVLGLSKGSTLRLLRLVGSGLKFCKEDLNMAAINFFPLQNLKWL